MQQIGAEASAQVDHAPSQPLAFVPGSRGTGALFQRQSGVDQIQTMPFREFFRGTTAQVELLGHCPDRKLRMTRMFHHETGRIGINGGLPENGKDFWSFERYEIGGVHVAVYENENRILAEDKYAQRKRHRSRSFF